MRNKFAFCLAALLMFTTSAFAQQNMSMEQARELALINSRSLARYNLAIQSSLLNEKTNKLNWLKYNITAGISASVKLWTKEGISADIIRDSLDAGANISLGSVSVTLFDGGKNAILREINTISTEQTRLNALAEYYSVINSVDSEYYSVLEAVAALEAAESSFATATLSLEMAEIRRANGMINDASYLQALSDMASKETSRNQSRRNLALANLRFRELLGIDYTPVLEPVNIDAHENLINYLAVIEDADYYSLFAVFRKEIQTRNPSFVNSALSSEIISKNVTSSQRDYLPTLSASLSLPGIEYSIRNGFNVLPGGVFSLSASIPLDFRTLSNNAERQRIAQQQSALDYRSASSTLDINLSVMLLNLISQAGQILSSRRALDYAQRHFDQALELYRMSRYSPSELSAAETILRSNRDTYNSLCYSFLKSLSNIKSAGVFNSDDEIINMIFSVADKR